MESDLRDLPRSRPADTSTALGVAVLGSLLGQGHALSLHVPLLVATAGYLIAVALVCVVIRDR